MPATTVEVDFRNPSDQRCVWDRDSIALLLWATFHSPLLEEEEEEEEEEDEEVDEDEDEEEEE